jgi:hypothetical protein
MEKRVRLFIIAQPVKKNEFPYARLDLISVFVTLLLW